MIMSWSYVYNELKKVLEEPEFKKKNLRENPQTPKDAILVALYKLNQEYSKEASKGCRKDFGV